MTLVIEVSPELERRLAEEAVRRGQSVEEFARRILEDQVARHPVDTEASWLAGLPRPDQEEVQALLRAQGARPVLSFDDLLGTDSEQDDEEEFDVDEFLRERRQWQWQGAPGFPEAAEQQLPSSSRKR